MTPDRGAADVLKRALRKALGEKRYYEARVHKLVWQNYLHNRPALFVHQMGKVGSSTIIRSLRAAGLSQKTAIYWSHFLSLEGTQLLENLEKEGYGDWNRFPVNIKSMVTREWVLGSHLRYSVLTGEKCQVITLVRDPVAVNVAGFFQNYAWWPAGLKAACENNDPDCLTMLAAHFLAHYPHHVPLTRFDAELRDVFGINVFAEPFPKAAGYKIYYGAKVDLLLIRLENLNACYQVAFNQFLNCSSFNLVNANKSREKWYAGIYQTFKKSGLLPDHYLNEMYSSKLADHFYTAAEIDVFRKKWMPKPLCAHTPTR